MDKHDIERIVYYSPNTDEQQHNAGIGKKTYRVLLYRYPPLENTLESIRYLLRNKLLIYYRCFGVEITKNINTSIAGLLYLKLTNKHQIGDMNYQQNANIII